MSRHRRCKVTDKLRFETFALVVHAALVSNRKRGTPLRPYVCEHCSRWHLTKRPANPETGDAPSRIREAWLTACVKDARPPARRGARPVTDEGFLLPTYLVVGIQKFAAEMLVSREALGIDDRTDEQRDADRTRWHAERVEAWRLYAAARPALAAITDTLARAILDLHHADTEDWPKCQGCEFDGYEAEEPNWPCATVRLVAAQYGVALPDGRHDLDRRPEETA